MKTPLACLTIGLLASLAPQMDAQTLEARFIGFGPSQPTKGVIDGDVLFDHPAGVLEFDTFSAFCVDPLQILVPGETIVYSVQDPATLVEIGAVQRILGGYYASGRTSLDAAGAQWAIWEALGDGTTDPTFVTGLVRLHEPQSAVAVRALDYLANLDTLPALPVMYLTNPCRQDMIVVIPEPAIAALAGCTLVWLGLRRRR